MSYCQLIVVANHFRFYYAVDKSKKVSRDVHAVLSFFNTKSWALGLRK